MRKKYIQPTSSTLAFAIEGIVASSPGFDVDSNQSGPNVLSKRKHFNDYEDDMDDSYEDEENF